MTGIDEANLRYYGRKYDFSELATRVQAEIDRLRTLNAELLKVGVEMWVILTAERMHPGHIAEMLQGDTLRANWDVGAKLWHDVLKRARTAEACPERANPSSPTDETA